jgi:1-acyl-sn-glycerol-3-phosphate acyltransferase
LSEAANSLGAPEREREQARDRAVPQWVIELVRPVVRFISSLCWRIEFHGSENIPLEGGLIIAANHQTYVDPFWISLAIERPIRYLAWSEAFKNPLLGKPMELLGAWPLVVERGNPTAYRRSLKWLRNGGAVMIFPEGSRATESGVMGKFKSGAARLALEADVPVLPVTLRGGNHIWPRGQRWPRTGTLEITYHSVHKLEMLPGEGARHCARRESEILAGIIRSAL